MQMHLSSLSIYSSIADPSFKSNSVHFHSTGRGNALSYITKHGQVSPVQ